MPTSLKAILARSASEERRHPSLALRASIALLAIFYVLPCTWAQESRTSLVALLPDEFGLCLVVHDLRGHAQLLEKSTWLKRVSQSSLGRAITEAPELQQLEYAKDELKRALGIDWKTLRDDILGDEVLLAYRPSIGNSGSEQGVILIRAGQPELLSRLVQRALIQKSTQEELKPERYKNVVYQSRLERGKLQYFFQQGPLLAVTGEEATIRQIIDRLTQTVASTATWPSRFQKAGVEQAVLTLCINPRILTPALVEKSKQPPLPPGTWKALDAIFVSVHATDAVEVRLTLQAKPENLPSWLRPTVERTPSTSRLWQRFPEQAIITLAAQTNFAEAVAGFLELLPAGERKTLIADSQRHIGAVLGLDIFKDAFPNLGPDWGICLLPAKEPQDFPHVIAALAIQPGTKQVDLTLSKSLHLLAMLAVFDYNKKHQDTILIQSVQQDGIDVKFLVNEQIFPVGLRPAWVLKDGFLLIASSPEAILRFRNKPDAPREEADASPLFRLSTQGLANLLKSRRESIIQSLGQKQKSRTEVEQNLTNLVEFLETFDHVRLNQRAGNGQTSWSLHIVPAR